MTFTRCFKTVTIFDINYIAVSEVVANFCDFDTIVAYIVYTPTGFKRVWAF